MSVGGVQSRQSDVIPGMSAGRGSSSSLEQGAALRDADTIAGLEGELRALAVADPAAFRVALQTALGDKASDAQIDQLLSEFSSGDFTAPDVQFVNAGELGGDALGAYSADGDGVIYLDRRLLSDPEQLASVYTEEMGHHLDSVLGGNDASGDEGAVFAQTLRDGPLDSEALSSLQAENDFGTIVVAGREVFVEFHGGGGADGGQAAEASDTGGTNGGDDGAGAGGADDGGGASAGSGVGSMDAAQASSYGGSGSSGVGSMDAAQASSYGGSGSSGEGSVDAAQASAYGGPGSSGAGGADDSQGSDNGMPGGDSGQDASHGGTPESEDSGYGGHGGYGGSDNDGNDSAFAGVTTTSPSERAREAAENGQPPPADDSAASDPFGGDGNDNNDPEPAFRTPGGFDPQQQYGRPDFGAPLPDEDWTENWFGEGNHRYSHVSPPVNASYWGLMDTLNTVGVHPNQTREFVPGEPYVGDVDIPGPFGVDNVRSTAIYDPNGLQIGVRNETLPNHRLHPGVVERTIVQEDGRYHIQTRGGGYGGLGGPNVWFDAPVWNGVDARVIEQFE